MAAALRANIRSTILVMDSSSLRPTSLAGFRSPAQAAAASNIANHLELTASITAGIQGLDAHEMPFGAHLGSKKWVLQELL
jgi:hypothetical protein